MDAAGGLLTRLAPNGLDAPMLILAAVLILALSGIIAAVSHSCQNVLKDTTHSSRKLTRKLSNIGLTTLVTEVPTNLSIPITVITVYGNLTKADLVERLRSRLQHDSFFLRWRSVVRGDYVKGVFKFVEVPEYDIEQNVVEHTITEGETIMSYIESALVNVPLHFNKPLWEMHVICDPGNAGITSVGWKVHHCLGDGASLAMAMEKLSDQSKASNAMLEKRTGAKPNQKTFKAKKSLAQIVRDILIFFYVCLWSTYVITYHTIALFARHEPATAFKRPGGRLKRLSYSMVYSVETSKAVGKLFQSTVNDVMLTIVAGAMRKTLLAVGESVAPSLKVRCAIPVDMRTSTEVIRHTSNRFSSLLIDLPIGIENPVQRLHHVTASMNEAKSSLEKYFVYWSNHLISMLPAPLMRIIVHFVTSRMSVATTNVRSSAVVMSLCKKQVSGFYGFVPPPPYVNLGVAILSMGDELGLNALVDPCVGVDAKQFLDFAKEEFEALREAVAAIEAKPVVDKSIK
ncbi:hypothetical protein CCR75_003042 [Bremia lactucae]|uniref:Diacylglycerol O-acyltransferase n=1 Tax=Bremia lactucae TaxID=4779 RepID=A0A976P0G7_BRELC|nr:hypothetical protein CCR75_003042 [Bremia lactucae]